jgi:two-component system response regulator
MTRTEGTLSRAADKRPETGRPHSILLVEDNPADVKIMQRALALAEARTELVIVRDGQEALDYLLRQGPYAPEAAAEGSVPALPGPWRIPDLVVLDLNLPRLTGIELLKQIRTSPRLCLLPVVVLSTSRRPEDVREAYSAGANTYIEKPHDFDRFVQVLRVAQQFWLEMALLPPPPVG